MPTFTDPAQQSTSRPELSSNWRSKVDVLPRTGNRDAAIRTPGLPSKPDTLQQRDFWSKSRDTKEDKSNGPVSGVTLRGEDDPNTLQAIAEGRRLYVGNMSYIAKIKDVDTLFAGGNYQV